MNYRPLGDTLVNKDRKLICPRCHRTVGSSEFAEHIKTHKGKHLEAGKRQISDLANLVKQDQMGKSEVLPKHNYECSCGLEFGNRDDLWNHLGKCKDKTDSRQTCLICSEPEEIFLSTDNIDRICPTCALGYFDSKKILGVPFINHMGIEYENAFRDNAGELLKYLGISTLGELGVTVVLVTFSADGSVAYCFSPKGEVVFILNDTMELKKQNFETFKSVIKHELFHAYVANTLKLGITKKLHHALTFVGGNAAQVAEDIESLKIAVKKSIEPIFRDEVNRTRAYFENTPVKSLTYVPDNLKFLATVGVSWNYAQTQWLANNVRDPNLKDLFSQNLELVRPHYEANGFPKLKDLISNLLNGKIVETDEEAEIVFQKILKIYGELLYSKNLDLQ